MSSGGLSRRLARMRDAMVGYVERGEIPGIVTLVSRRGETHVDAIGTKAVGGTDPMRRDTIFRTASMTKPITAAPIQKTMKEAELAPGPNPPSHAPDEWMKRLSGLPHVILGANRGWGFGVAMVIRRDDLAAPGRFGWDGGYGTSWASDPKEDMVAILLMQRLWDSPSPPAVCLDFWTTAYQSIDD